MGWVFLLSREIKMFWLLYVCVVVCWALKFTRKRFLNVCVCVCDFERFVCVCWCVLGIVVHFVLLSLCNFGGFGGE